MKNLLKDPRIDSILYSETQIKKRVKEMAAQIALNISDLNELCIICVLKGAVPFAHDLSRELSKLTDTAITIDYLRARTYSSGMKTEGETSRQVNIELAPENVSNKDILIVEDILDQGFTLAHIRHFLLQNQGAKSVSIAVMLDKILENPTPEVKAIREEIIPDYVGYRVPDVWVAGYGLDLDEQLRELPSIVALSKNI